MKSYKHIFFDLDHTLWDLERNASETISELLETYNLDARINTTGPEFIREYNQINDALWEKLRKGEIDRTTLRYERFRQVFNYFGVEDEKLTIEFGNAFVKESPRKPHLIDGAREVLDYLSGKYTLHIITNGFADAQDVKIEFAKIGHYFTHIVNSEQAGCNKPDARIFNYSLELAGASTTDSIMVGDHLEADILGAKNAGLDQIYYNPLGKEHDHTLTYEVRHLRELSRIL
ncbi:MAG: YjjG family noncanonical pyrimidine nucleotidase [Bacteroidia bacterium]